MKRYIVSPSGVIDAEKLLNNTIIKRNTNGVDISVDDSAFTTRSTWTGRTIPADYNNPSFYIRGQAVDDIAGSTAENTLITNDGLIAVFRGTNILEIVDIFEPQTETYESIMPNGNIVLENYDESVNPMYKRIFIVDADVDNVLSTKNLLQYIDTKNNYHFSSQFDYDLLVDEYGFYVTTETEWNNNYHITSNFQFYKKQYFRIESGGAISLTMPTGDENVIIDSSPVNDVYTLKYLNSTDENKFINIQIKSTEFEHGYIIVY